MNYSNDLSGFRTAGAHVVISVVILLPQGSGFSRLTLLSQARISFLQTSQLRQVEGGPCSARGAWLPFWCLDVYFLRCAHIHSQEFMGLKVYPRGKVAAIVAASFFFFFKQHPTFLVWWLMAIQLALADWVKKAWRLISSQGWDSQPVSSA